VFCAYDTALSSGVTVTAKLLGSVESGQINAAGAVEVTGGAGVLMTATPDKRATNVVDAVAKRDERSTTERLRVKGRPPQGTRRAN